MTVLSVRDIMIADPVVVEPHTGVRDAARLMHERNINSVLVCSNGRIDGILTSRDLLRHAAGDRSDALLTVGELMTASPTTIEAESAFDAALELMDQQHVRHLPVVEKGRLVGILSIRDLMHHRARFLEEIVQRQTAELRERHNELQERDRNMQIHLELAGRIQHELLPARVPVVPPLSLAVAYQPLHHVSGDTYDFTVLANGRIGIFIADARGHGVPAAFVTVMARMVFQAFGQDDRSPAQVLDTLNERLPKLIQADHFITICYAVVDRTNLRMTWSSAGHPPPLRYRSVNRRVERLMARGDLIGVHAAPVFEERTVQLRRNDLVLFYTDGLVEARDEQHAFFGEQGVSELLLEHQGASATEVLAALSARLRDFCGSRSTADDVTAIALRVG